MRLIDADALIADCQLAQKQADRHGREFANAFYSDGGEVSTEWWCVEDMIENAPIIEPERKKGEWLANGDIHTECPFCGEDWDKYVFGEVWYTGDLPKFCPNCGADMREGEA